MTYEEYFKRHTELIYRNVGVSMLPMLKQGRDLFILKKKTDQRCKKYVILGDNCEHKEYGIKEEDILAVMDSFVRKGKIISVSNWKYKLYAYLWYGIYPFRKQIFRWKRMAGRVRRVAKKAKK